MFVVSSGVGTFSRSQSMKRKLGMTAALVVALAAAGYAQKPDFSGTWTPEPAADTTTAAPPAGGGGGGGGGMRGGGGGGPMTVKQNATGRALETQGRNGAQTRAPQRGGAGAERAMG